MAQKADLTNIFRGLKLIRMLNLDPHAKIGPLRVALSPTSACNYQCVFCGSHSYLSTPVKPEDIDFSVLDRALKEIRETGTDNLFWCGNGEPTLSQPMIDFINRNEHGFTNDILTNGSMLGRIDRVTFSHITILKISLNSGNGNTHQLTHHYKGENQFPKIVKNIERLVDYPDGQHKIKINYVITKENQDEVEDLGKMCRRWGITYCARPIDAFNPDLAYLKIEGQDNKKILRACYVGFIQCYIQVNGDVLLCCGLSDRPLGNIFKENLRDIWVRTRNVRMTAAAMDKTQIPLARGCPGCVNAVASSVSFHNVYSKIPLLSRWKKKWGIELREGI